MELQLGTFLLFGCASVGMTLILVDSAIFMPVREWFASKPTWIYQKISEALECHQCTGYWSGLLCGAVIVSTNPLEVLICGFAGSYLAVLTSAIMSRNDGD